MNSSAIHASREFPQIALLRNDDGSMRIGRFSTSFDPQIEESLLKLSSEMQAWDALAVDKLLDGMKSIDPDFHVGRNETAIFSILQRYIQDVKEVLNHIDVEEAFPLFSSSLHDWWIYPDSISRIQNYSQAIRKFDVDRESVLLAAHQLEGDDSSNLLKSYDEGIAMQEFLLESLQEYEAKFDDYIIRAEEILPGIFDRKDYCRSFLGKYGTGELDYYMYPGNNVIVASMNEYVEAYKLEQAQMEFDKQKGNVLLANRFLGRHLYSFDIDESCDLSVTLSTNFGFGKSSYFNATLNYKGVSAINAFFVIFYRVAGMTEFSGSTYDYEVHENSFPIFFENVRDINNEYLSIGEARFVDKYFRQSLVDLSKLLSIIANSDTFLEVTTLSRLNDLTGEKVSHLVPVGDFDDIDLELSAAEKEKALELSTKILPYMQNGEEILLGEDEEIDTLVRAMSEPAIHHSVLQSLIKQDLIRNELISLLNENDVPTKYVFEVVDGLLPQETGMRAKSFDGYGLIDYRATAVSRVISLMERLKEIAGLVNFDEIIDELFETSAKVCNQARSYKVSEIAPRLMELKPTKDELEEKLESLRDQKEQLLEENLETGGLDERIKILSDKLRPIASEVHQLEAQDSRLEAFINSVEQLRLSP